MLGETDSYMYQTVGQDAIKLVAEALEVPLFRRVIQGQAINQNVEYGSRLSLYTEILEGDETEDLFALLSEVKVIIFSELSVRKPNIASPLSLTYKASL